MSLTYVALAKEKACKKAIWNGSAIACLEVKINIYPQAQQMNNDFLSPKAIHIAKKKKKWAVLRYLKIVFGISFLLLLPTYLVKRHRRPDVFKIFLFDLIFWIFKFQTTHIVSHEEAFSRCIWYSCYSYAQVAVSCNCFTFDLLFLCYNWNGMFWTYGSEELLY